MLLSVFTRHSTSCRFSRDRACRRCNCPKWVGGQVNGYYFRQSAKTRQWAEAEEVRVKLEEALIKGLPPFGLAMAGGSAPQPTTTPAAAPPASRPGGESFASGAPGRDGVFPGAPVRETLDRGASGFQRTGRCAFLADGSFEVSSTPFPRVYRSLVMNCRERCDLISRDGASALLTDSVPVVSGEASFKWLQTSPDPSLGMTISLVRQDGTTIDKVFIEP